MDTSYEAHCDCGKVSIRMQGIPRVHGNCHCNDCRELLQVPYHPVLAYLPEKLEISKGSGDAISFQHPTKKMTRVFCQHCGETLYNTNGAGWKVVSQLLFEKCNGSPLPDELKSTSHFWYGRRIVDIADDLPKRD